MALILENDGTEKAVEPLNGKDFKLEQLQEIVGGLIELVYMPDGRLMVIDEEGKLKGKAVNTKATELSGLYPHDIIVGTALVCKQKEMK